MKLENKEFGFDSFASEMAKLKNEKHFDYLITIVGEDFGKEEGLGCIYILENTQTHERISVKQIAKQVGEEYVIPTVLNLWADADLLEREVYDFLGIKFLGHPDMRRLYLRNDFSNGYPLRKDFDKDPTKNMYSLEDDIEWIPQKNGTLMRVATLFQLSTNCLPTTTMWLILDHNTLLCMVCCVCKQCWTVKP